VKNLLTLRKNAILFVVGLLVAIDLAVRLFGGNPVEATRISGRETDQATHDLADSNYELARSNFQLAASLEQVASFLRATGSQGLADTQNQDGEAQDSLALSAKSIADSVTALADVLQSRDDSSSKGEGEGE